MTDDIFDYSQRLAKDLEEISQKLTKSIASACSDMDSSASERRILRAFAKARKSLNAFIYEATDSDLYSQVFQDTDDANNEYIKDAKNVTGELQGWDFYDGKLVIVIPILPSFNSHISRKKDFEKEISYLYLNTVKEIMNKMENSSREDVKRFIHTTRNKTIVFAFNYGNDIEKLRIPDAANHYTDKLQNAVLDRFTAADGERTGTYLRNTIEGNARSGTYIFITDNAQFDAGFLIEDEVNTAAERLSLTCRQ